MHFDVFSQIIVLGGFILIIYSCAYGLFYGHYGDSIIAPGSMHIA